MDPAHEDLTRLLVELSGTPNGVDKAFPAVYGELRRLARHEIARLRPGHTLDSSALVHEAYLRLSAHGDVRWESRAHFFGIAARAMRSILVDYARARSAAKRGGAAVALPLDEVPGLAVEGRAEHLLALDDALTRLAAVDEHASRTAEWHYFAGLTHAEIAELLGTSVATVRRRWDFAKAWLRRELERTA